MRAHLPFPHAAATLAAAATFAITGSAAANVPLTQISSDTFTNSTSQHATEVEPDTFASGSTVLSAFQVGRFFSGGATDIGFARSTDGGTTWTHGSMPGLTATSGIPGSTGAAFERVSDASTAFDAKHATWLVSSIPLEAGSLDVPTVFINRSTDGATWSDPASIPPPAVPATKVNLDKNWTTCDNTTTSPFYGNCYTEFDNFGQGDLEYMSTSSDGGATWSVPLPTAGNDKGLGGQPLVQPNGTVIVPFEALNGKIQAFSSTNGGASWNRAVTISDIRFHDNTGGLRTSPLPSAEMDKAGTVYVAWEDCRFRKNCTSNDIVLSTSSNGSTWSPVVRVPIDAVTSGADHFIPGLAVDRSQTAGRVALSYYFYPDATCTPACRLDVGFISSPDGGAHWGAPTQLAGPMSLADIAQTSQGPMTGDYISTSFSGRKAVPVFAVGLPHNGPFDEAMYAPATPLSVASAAQATRAATSSGVQGGGTGTGPAHQAIRNN